MYMFFSAFPIIYQVHRGWDERIRELSFCGIAVGVVIGISYMFPENRRYLKVVDRREETPESRLPPSIVGSMAIRIGISRLIGRYACAETWLIKVSVARRVRP